MQLPNIKCFHSFSSLSLNCPQYCSNVVKRENKKNKFAVSFLAQLTVPAPLGTFFLSETRAYIVHLWFSEAWSCTKKKLLTEYGAVTLRWKWIKIATINCNYESERKIWIIGHPLHPEKVICSLFKLREMALGKFYCNFCVIALLLIFPCQMNK